MKQLLTLFILLICFSTQAQIAIIQDKDGYTNVRKEPNSKSEIVHKIYESEVFWFDYNSYYKKESWVQIFYAVNDFSMGCGDFSTMTGYIHISRLKPLEEMTAYRGTDFTFRYNTQPFDASTKIIQREEGYIVAVDGSFIWGTDGTMPTTEIANITCMLDGKSINIHRMFYSDTFQVTNDFKIYKSGDAYIVSGSHSDGAGYYELVWVINRYGVQQRLVGSMM